jgi:aromatic ring hydroxylase
VPNGRSGFHEQELICRIAGGLPSTFPYEGDLTHPDLKKVLEKYLNRNPKVPVEDQIKFWMTLGDYTIGTMAGVMNYGNYHGGGSPIMEQIAITSQYDIKDRKKLIKRLAGIGG